jgi:hypothetical protein
MCYQVAHVNCGLPKNNEQALPRHLKLGKFRGNIFMEYRIGSHLAFQTEQPRARSLSAPPAALRETAYEAPKMPVQMSNNPTILQYRETADYQKKCIQRLERFTDAQHKLVNKLRQLGSNARDLNSVSKLSSPLMHDCTEALFELIVPIPRAVTEEMSAYSLSCKARLT